MEEKLNDTKEDDVVTKDKNENTTDEMTDEQIKKQIC